MYILRLPVVYHCHSAATATTENEGDGGSQHLARRVNILNISRHEESMKSFKMDDSILGIPENHYRDVILK